MMVETFHSSETEVLLTKAGKVRKRKPKTSNVYFTEETENAILRYLASEDPVERNRLFNDHINYALYKLAENIIHTFKFYYMEVSTIEELKFEIIALLLEKLHKFNHSTHINTKLNKIIVKQFGEEYKNHSFSEFVNHEVKVTKQQIDEFLDTLDVSEECMEELRKLSPPKAYSYFGTVVKHWLINHNKKNYEKRKERAAVEDIDTDRVIVSGLIDQVDKEQDLENMTAVDIFVEYVDSNLEKLFPKERDAQVVDAILEIFRKRERLDILSKKALYIYIREMTSVPTPVVTSVIKKLKNIFDEIHERYLTSGYNAQIF